MTRRKKLFMVFGGVVIVIVAIILVFSLVEMPGGGKLFAPRWNEPFTEIPPAANSIVAPSWNDPESDTFNKVTIYMGNVYVRRDNEGGVDEFAFWVDIGKLFMMDRSVVSLLGSDKSDKGVWVNKNCAVGDMEKVEWGGDPPHLIIGGPFYIPDNRGLRFRVALYEIDTKGILTQTLDKFGIKIGADDPIGVPANFDINPDELTQITNSPAVNEEKWGWQARTVKGEKTYYYEFKGDAGDVQAQFIVKVE